MLRNLVRIVSLGLALAACGNITSNGATEIRVANRSGRDFDRVTVQFTEKVEDYGSVGRGEATAYRNVGPAYSYARIEVQTGGATVVLQPIDFVGEKLLGPGRFTYALDTDGQTLLLELVRD